MKTKGVVGSVIVIMLLCIIGYFGWDLFSSSGVATKNVEYITPSKTGHEGELLPGFSLLLSDSLRYVNTKDVEKGQPIVLFYFGPNCPYCRAEMKKIIRDMENLRNVRFYMITPFPVSEMKQFIEEFRLQTYSNITTGNDVKLEFGNYFKVKGIPFMAIYDSDMKLVAAFDGGVSPAQIRKMI